MFGFSTLQTGAAGLGLVGLLWWLYDNRAYLASFIPAKKASDPNAVPTGEEAYAAVMLLRAFFKAKKCKEGAEAAVVCGSHLFHDEPE